MTTASDLHNAPITHAPCALSPQNRLRVAAAAGVQERTVLKYERGASMKPTSIERIETALDTLGLAKFKRAAPERAGE